MQLSKWHGLGNDYLLVERAGLPFPLTPDRVRRICDYHFGVGSDGILEVVEVRGGEADIVIWNPDGSTAELSGNGTRIAARWLARRAGAEAVTVHVGPRAVHARMQGGLLVETALGVVVVGEPEELNVGTQVAPEHLAFIPVDVGNPHAVIRREPERAEVRRLGPLVEHHARFPRRTNVQLVRVDGPHDVTVGVWERGAGETLASGSSSTAVAAAAVVQGWCESPVTVHLGGGDLVVSIDRAADGALTARQTGEAQEICTVEISAETLADLVGLT
jgi:diaminopimelate epimerase